MIRWLAVAAVVGYGAGCGDNLHRDDDPLAAVSGARLALHKYRYDDGTELAVAGEFYDTLLHVRCRPQPWIDGATRCVPAVDDVVYSDTACTAPLGIGRTITRPTYFVAYDEHAAGTVAKQLFRAAGAATRIALYYRIVAGACAGPVGVPPDFTSFFELGEELDGTTLIAFRDAEVGDARFAAVVREADDGTRVPTGLRDRELDAPCAPRPQSDGRVLCEPTTAAPATLFSDPACTAPVLAAGASVPPIARVVEPSGCASYRRVGGELATPLATQLYRRDGDACTAATGPSDTRLFSLDAPLDLPPLERTLDEVPGRRLRRVTLAHGDLRVLDDRLFDTAIGTDCRARTLRDGVRCLPTTVASTPLFTAAGCATVVRVAEIPARSCEPPAYATSNRPFQVFEIGALATTALFRLEGTACRLYTPPRGMELHTLGPPLDITTFLAGVYFSER